MPPTAPTPLFPQALHLTAQASVNITTLGTKPPTQELMWSAETTSKTQYPEKMVMAENDTVACVDSTVEGVLG